MKMKIKKELVLKVILVAVLLILPVVALAQAGGAIQQGLTSVQNEFPRSGIASARTVTDLIALIIRWLLIIMGAIAVLFVVIGGYQYMTSAGNEEAAEKGKKTLINALIGVVIAIMAYVIVTVVVNLVSGYGFGFGGLF